MSILATLNAASLLASALFAAAPQSTCATFVAPAAMAQPRHDDPVGQAVDRFLGAAPGIADPHLPVAIYAPATDCDTLACNAERTTRRAEAIRELILARGIDTYRISLVGLHEGRARFGDQPPGTVILIAGDPRRPTCDAELRARP